MIQAVSISNWNKVKNHHKDSRDKFYFFVQKTQTHPRLHFYHLYYPFKLDLRKHRSIFTTPRNLSKRFHRQQKRIPSFILFDSTPVSKYMFKRFSFLFCAIIYFALCHPFKMNRVFSSAFSLQRFRLISMGFGFPEYLMTWFFARICEGWKDCFVTFEINSLVVFWSIFLLHTATISEKYYYYRKESYMLEFSLYLYI